MAAKSISVENPCKQSQARLAESIESEELARALIRSAGTGIYIVQEGKFQYVNSLFQELTGYTQEELLGTYSLNFVHPEDRQIVRKKAIENLKGQQSPFPYEYRFIKKDGNILWVLERVTSTEYRGKRAAVGSFMDIVERKHMEEELRKSEERYRLLAESVTDVIWTMDMNLQYTYISPSIMRMRGYSAEEAMLQTLQETLHPSSFELVTKVFAEELAMESIEQKDLSRSRTLELELKRKDGSTVWTEATVSFLRDSNGQAIGILGVTRDITERKKADEQTRGIEELYRKMVELSPDSIFTIDTKGVVTLCNTAATRLLGYSKDELVGKHFLKLGTLRLRDTPKYLKIFRSVIKGKTVEPIEVAFLHKDGTTRLVDVRVALLKVSGKTVIQTIASDITERKQAEREREALLQELEEINSKLQQSNKELQDFAYIASHDLREPLRKISSFGVLLQDSLEGKLDEDQQENFGFMIDGAKRMQEMIDDLLTYSRLTTRAKPPEWVDLNRVIEDLKSLELATLLDETKGAIHVPKPLLPVQGDLSQMHQLLQNLIGNGLKFHRKGVSPETTIRAHRIENNMVRVEIQDNGIGIDEQYQEEVFTMFKRLHSKEQYEGTGIGLAICKKIVNRHGGKIGVKSTPGEGSTFWFTLPRGSYSGNN